MRKRIVVIETSAVGARYTGLAIRQLGFEPLFVLGNLMHYHGDTRRQLLGFDGVTCANSRDAQAVCRALSGTPDIVAVTSLLDSRLAVAVRVAAMLGIRGPDPALVELGDKAAVARLLPEYSPQSVVVRDGSPLAPALAVLADVEQVLVKPCRGGSEVPGAVFLQQAEQDIAHYVAAQAPAVDAFLIQPYLPGRVLSVEGYVQDGTCHFLGFSLRKRIGRTEAANLFPGDRHLAEPVRAHIQRAISLLVRRAGVRDGYFHSEFMVDADHVWLLDANIGRIAGAAIAIQMACAFALDPVALFAHVVAVGCLASRSPLPLGEPEQTLSLCYGLAEPARLEHIELPPLWDLHHTQLCDAQAEIPAMGGNNRAWLGLVAGPLATVLAQIDGIVIVTGHGHCRPYYLAPGQSLRQWP